MPELTLNLRGVQLHKSEQALVPGAIADLGRFDDYDLVFGRTSPKLAALCDTLEAAHEWSSAVSAAEQWFAYVRAQESIAWADAHALLLRMRPAFRLASSADASLPDRFPSLARLVAARRIVARRGAAARAGTLRDVAAGREPSHGKAAARRLRVLRQAAAMQAESTSPASGPAPTPEVSGGE
jgi:hypothetical protein